MRLKRDGTRAETRFRLSPKRTSPLKSAGALVQSTVGSRGVGISVSNAGYTAFRGSFRVLATHSIPQFPFHFSSRASPCAIRFQTHSTYRLHLRTFYYDEHSLGVQYTADWLRNDTSLHLIAVTFRTVHCIEPFTVKAVLNLTAFPSIRTEAQYSKFINIWCAIPLQSIFSLQYTINVHVEYLHYSGSVASKSTLTTSSDVYSHTQQTAL